MVKEFQTAVLIYLIENIAILILCGFLCWYFKTLWGLIPLLFTNTRIRVNQEENKNDE
jgi:hypothetical protein